MHLVHEVKGGYGKWEVAWMWMPHFLTIDQDLIRQVDQEMTKRFRGETIKEPLLEQMDQAIIHTVLAKYPISGLKGYLEALIKVDPSTAEES